MEPIAIPVRAAFDAGRAAFAKHANPGSVWPVPPMDPDDAHAEWFRAQTRTPDGEDSAAFKLGYLATFARCECGEWVDLWDSAMAAVGAHLADLGLIDNPCGSDHTPDEWGTCEVCGADL